MPKQKARATNKLSIKPVFGATFRLWRTNFNLFTKIVLVVAIPSSVLNVLNTQGLIGEYGLLLSLAWSFVIIAILQLARDKSELVGSKIGTIFTAASGRILQYVAVSLILLVFALPLILSLLGLLLAQSAFGIPPIVFVPISTIAFALGAYLLVCFSVSQAITVNQGTSIYQSLKLSAECTKGNRLRVFLSYFVLIAGMLMILMAIQFILSINQTINENSIISGIVYILEAVVFVPIAFIFQQKIYESLKNEKA